MRRNLKITLSYDGSEFRGWQIQPGLPTVQGVLADCLGRITKEKVLPQGSGRTDAGVHALGQVASVSLESPIPEWNLQIALNDVLPPPIRVMGVERVEASFHARHSATAKTYRYRIYREKICPPFLARYVYPDPYPMDEDAMIAASEHIVGTFDFTSFAASDPERSARLATALGTPRTERARFGVVEQDLAEVGIGGADFNVDDEAIPFAAMASCTIWCEIWWEHFSRWAKVRCSPTTSLPFSRRRTEALPVRPLPPAASTWSAWST